MPTDLESIRDLTDPGSETRSALDYLVALAGAAGYRMVVRNSGAVPAVEFQRPDRGSNPFAVQPRPRHLNFYLRGPILQERTGLFKAATRRFGAVSPNGREEYRLHLHAPAEVDDLLAFLRGEGAWPSDRHASRFTSPVLDAVTGEHLLAAARRLAGGADPAPFGPSTDYDVLFDGVRLPPKAVFGHAATQALGFAVRPENFRGGEGTKCFRTLRANGYPVVAKRDPIGRTALTDEDRTWTEGRPRLVTHLARERGTGLAAAKRASFKARHGRLLCERCGMDPVASFGTIDGEACIEVHHRATSLAEMEDGHLTRLEDLQCLCANCHRFVHRLLQLDAASAPPGGKGPARTA